MVHVALHVHSPTGYFETCSVEAAPQGGEKERERTLTRIPSDFVWSSVTIGLTRTNQFRLEGEERRRRGDSIRVAPPIFWLSFLFSVR